jgi:hypothetical protein
VPSCGFGQDSRPGKRSDTIATCSLWWLTHGHATNEHETAGG